MTGRLERKVALITGSSRGIGAEIARGYAAEGAQVIITYKGQRDLAEKVAKEIGAPMCLQMDITKKEDIISAYEKINKKLGKLDVLVQNAGFNITNDYEHLDDGDFDRVVEGNLKGPFMVTKYAIPYMNDGGSILLIGSLSGLNGGPRTPSYSAAKAGVGQLTVCLARYLAPKNITVNCIHPGVIAGEMTAATMHPSVMETALQNLMIKRLGDYKDLVPMAITLVEPANHWMTAQQVSVNGGAFF